MNITICDDQKNELDYVCSAVSEYAKEHTELSVKIKCFVNPLDMLDDIRKNGAPDIALLDICMPGVLGTEIAKEIQGRDGGNTDIIFLTASSEFAVEAFSLHVSDYITKPFSGERFTETLDRVIKNKQNTMPVPVTCGREIHIIDLYRVEYAESRNHNVEIHLKDGKCIKTHTALTELKGLFDNIGGFTAVGASYIVNLRCVQSILQSELVMTDGQNIPIPRRLKNEIRDRYFDFYREEALKK